MREIPKIVQNLEIRDQGNKELLKMTLAGTSTYEFYYYPKDGRLINSRRLCNKFGYDDVMENVPECFEWKPIVSPEYKRSLIKAFYSILGGGKRESFIFKTVDEMFWVRATISVICVDESGYPTYAVGLLEDITKEKEHEIKVKTLEQKNEEILFAMSGLYYAINIVDFEADKMEFVRAADDIMQLIDSTKKYSVIIKKIAEKFYHPEDRERFLNDFSKKNLEKCNKAGKEYFIGEYRRKVEGGWHWVSALAFFMNKNAYHRIVILALQDINEQYILREKRREQEKKTEQETKQLLSDALNRAERASEAKSDFLSKMSHDIRTPMNAIMGMAALAEKYIDDKEKVRDCINKINVSGKHLLDLINEVLDMSKIESGKLDLEIDNFNLTELVQNTLSMMRPLIEDKKQQFVVKMEDIVHKDVKSDKLRFQQILDNLLTNANKYTPEGGCISFTMEELYTVDKEGHSSWYRFIVEDNGIGIEEDYLPYIFEPFSRASDSRTSKIAGTGLGMTITNNLVYMMNGEIKVKSKAGKGSEFTVTLPFVLNEEESTVPNHTAQSNKKLLQYSFKGKRILLVEDNELNMEIANELLLLLGCIVDKAQNGKIAVEKFENTETENYDLIFMDIRMPVMNGYEAAEIIRKLDKKNSAEIPIIAVTADAFSEDIRKAINAGMNEHLSKPVDIEAIRKVLATWVKV